MNKQIEEMWNIITTDCDRECAGCEFENDEWCFTHRVVKELYNAGYRKQSEGEWKKVSEKSPRYVCTACNHLFNNKEYRFCPNCGAKMKGGARE